MRCNSVLFYKHYSRYSLYSDKGPSERRTTSLERTIYNVSSPITDLDQDSLTKWLVLIIK